MFAIKKAKLELIDAEEVFRSMLFYKRKPSEEYKDLDSRSLSIWDLRIGFLLVVKDDFQKIDCKILTSIPENLIDYVNRIDFLKTKRRNSI